MQCMTKYTVPELSMKTRTRFILPVWILLCPHSAPSCITSLRTTAKFNLALLKYTLSGHKVDYSVTLL